jgi:hypothetical protein
MLGNTIMIDKFGEGRKSVKYSTAPDLHKMCVALAIVQIVLTTAPLIYGVGLAIPVILSYFTGEPKHIDLLIAGCLIPFSLWTIYDCIAVLRGGEREQWNEIHLYLYHSRHVHIIIDSILLVCSFFVFPYEIGADHSVWMLVLFLICEFIYCADYFVMVFAYETYYPQDSTPQYQLVSFVSSPQIQQEDQFQHKGIMMYQIPQQQNWIMY